MRILCHAVFILCSAFGSAQDVVKVSCRFLGLNSDSPPPPLLNIADKEIDIPCVITTGTLSPATTCLAREHTMTFVSATDRQPAAIATLPANVKAAILVFVAAPEKPNTLPWRVFVIEDSPKNLPDGGAFVANFHNQDIRFVIGEHKILLHSASFHGFSIPVKRDAFNMAPVAFEFLQKDQWRTASESLLRFVPGMRYLIFAYRDPASGRPRIATYQDLKPFATPPP